VGFSCWKEGGGASFLGGRAEEIGCWAGKSGARRIAIPDWGKEVLTEGNEQFSGSTMAESLKALALKA